MWKDRYNETMMLMKEIVEIEVMLMNVNYNYLSGSNRSEKMFFSRQPTDEQLIEAMRHTLSDRQVSSQVALSFMAAVKKLGVPEKNDYKEDANGEMIIHNNTTLYFDIKEV